MQSDTEAGPDNSLQPTIRLPLPPTEKLGDRIGNYKLQEKIGEGGCGVVYLADQKEPIRRQVALKVIKLGMDTKQVVARFEAERQALALMDHPNIAKVLEGGATETGRPYFVMELVRGIKITDYCDKHKLSTEDRLKLFIQVCHAIQHAHQKGVIHRDIKPSNVLVTLHDGVPVPKVIDFGIAKATTGQPLGDKTVFTAFEQFIGTPAYMSPEQAEMSGLSIDTRTDIYGLGVLLYELLTGKTPFDTKALFVKGLDEVRRIIREEEPPRPSARLSTLDANEQTVLSKLRQAEPPKLLGLIRGDLDWIAMKCLEKDRTRRYETAYGLAMEVQRHLNNEVVLARPPGTIYRFRKFVRRNRRLCIAGASITASLLLGLGLFLRERVRAEAAAQKSKATGTALQGALQNLNQYSLLLTYSELSGRNVLYGALPGQSFQPKPEESRMPKEVAAVFLSAIEQSFKEKGIVIQPEGAKFVVVVETNDFSMLANRVREFDQAYEGIINGSETIPPLSVNLVASPLSQFLRIYGAWIDHNVIRHPATPEVKIIFKNATALTKSEMLFAFRSSLALNRISVIETNKCLLVFPTDREQECNLLIEETPARKLDGNDSVPKGSIDLQMDDLSVVVPLYEKLTGQRVEVESNLPPVKLTFLNDTLLAKSQAVYTLDILLGYQGVRVIEQADGKTLRMLRAKSSPYNIVERGDWSTSRITHANSSPTNNIDSDQSDARARFKQVQETLDGGDPIRASLLLLAFKKRFEATDLANTVTTNVLALEARLAELLKASSARVENEYTFYPPTNDIRIWQTASNAAMQFWIDYPRARTKRFGVFRILLEDEESENRLQVSAKMGRIVPSSGEGKLYDRWVAIAGVRNGDLVYFDSEASGQDWRFQVGTLRHYSPTVTADFAQTNLIFIGTYVIHAIPKRDTGRIAIRLQPEAGLQPYQPRLQIGRFSYFDGSIFSLDALGVYTSERIASGTYQFRAVWDRGESTPQKIQVKAGQTADFVLPVYYPRRVEIEWLFRRYGASEWQRGLGSVNTGQYWQSGRWDIKSNFPVFSISPWDGEGCYLESSNCRWVPLKDFPDAQQDLSPASDSQPFRVQSGNTGTPSPIRIKEGLILGTRYRASAERPEWEAAIRIKSVASTGKTPTGE